MSEMVERMARFLCGLNVVYSGPLENMTLEERVEQEWEGWVDDVRGLLKEMYWPGYNIENAGGNVRLSDSESYLDTGDSRRVWQAMIDQILKGEGE